MKLDNNVTEKIKAWLSAEPKDAAAGAQLLFSLNRNRAMLNTIMRRPEKYLAKIEYELGKILRIRLDNMTMAEVAVLEKQVVASAEDTLKSAVIFTDDELPEAKHKGRRADHDSLPPEIQALWDSNFEVYKKINLLFEELKALNSARPCDRYDKLQMLKAADSRYRSNLAKYDAWTPDQQTKVLSEEEQKALSAARKSLSKWRGRYAEAAADEERAEALAKIQGAVNAIFALGQGIAEDTRAELLSIGIALHGGEA